MAKQNNKNITVENLNTDTIILAIETSCDETACAVVKNGREVLSSVVYSQIPLHQEFGGVVPEVASRNHAMQLPEVIDTAMKNAALSFENISAVAVTCAPGLVGALLTGVSYAKSLAYSLDLPLIAVNHIAGHICANYISNKDLTPPFVCLVVSGGHTHILEVKGYCEYKLLGATKDDACGEAFDKIARVLGLLYPGGPQLEKLAESGENIYKYPKAFKGQDSLDFSFSGLKTAVVRHLHELNEAGSFSKADVAASFQANVIEVLTQNMRRAVKKTGHKKIALSGGVCANKALRDAFYDLAEDIGIEAFVPNLEYSTDNAAMIGSAAYFQFINGDFADLSLNAIPRQNIWM